MKKIVTLFGLLALLCTQFIQAQNLSDATRAKQLVLKNASAIGLTAADIENVRISDAYYDKTSSSTMVYLQQTYKGVDIYNAISTVSFRNDKIAANNFYHLNDALIVSKNANAVPSVTAVTALQNAAEELGLILKQSPGSPLKRSADGKYFEFDKLDIAQNNITVKLQWIPQNDNKNYSLSWQAAIHSYDKNAMWLVNVDAHTGKIISKVNLTSYENFEANQNRPHYIYAYEVSEFNNKEVQTPFVTPLSINTSKYNVIPNPYESPLTATATLLTDPWTINGNQNANSLKWNSDGTTDYDITRGNNVYAQLDNDGKDNTYGYAPASQTALPDLTFNYPPDYLGDPTENPSFPVVNLFYWNNLMHDMSYQYGFDEPAGNFQENNQARGGKENDFVIADAQDASGSDNANFATPTDGNKPRMQMFLWSPSKVKTLLANLPTQFSGYKPAAESGVSNANKLAQTGSITNDVVLYKDVLHPDSSTACGGAANTSLLAGKIAYIDRGSCPFVDKFHNAQLAGALAIIVGNVAPDDPRYDGTNTGNFLVIMSATPLDNTIYIPGVFIAYDTAQKMKGYLTSAIKTNTTLSPSPRLDGDIDNGVVCHEYTHGISTRLTGGPNNSSCLNNGEQMGEGWSDYFALMMTTNWATASVNDGDIPRPIGNYAYGYDTDGPGIRTFPYSTDMTIDPWTYDSLHTMDFKEYSLLNSGSIYYTGEFWCTALWEMTWELIKTNGINPNFFNATATGGNSIAMHLVMEGLKLQKCSPGCVDGRNAILKADTLLYGGIHSDALWTAFAKRGLGCGASQGSNNKIKDAAGSYDANSCALPVTWGGFTAEKKGTTALLKWTTLQEVNTDKFIVERSGDGRVYTSIGTVKAAGNSSVEKSYSSPDAHPLKGNNNYRIKQVDKDGKANYSDTRYLNFADIKPYIKISPNPASDIVNINIAGNTQSLNIQLMSSTGQFISKYIMSGENYSFDVSTLAAGVYNIIIDGDGYSAKYKLVIQ